MNDLPNPFQQSSTLPATVNQGTVSIEQERAIAEVKGKLTIAKMFPRNTAQAYADIMESCKRPSFAKAAIYSYPRGGQNVTGPSIRMAEELARVWGNLEYGIRELSRNEGMSEMEAYCIDMQTNTITSQKFTVKHLRDKKGGATELTDERDIYEITANMGGRRMRARILAILPPDLVEEAMNQCRLTLAGKSDKPLADRVRQMIKAFSNLGITTAMLETRLGKKLDAILPDEFSDLIGIHNSLRDGHTQASEWFGSTATQIEEPKNEPQATKSKKIEKPTETVQATTEPEPTTQNPEVAPSEMGSGENDAPQESGDDPLADLF